MATKFLKKMINLTSPILIRGETGTGKSALARDIFLKSSINKERFITVHLASLKEDLLESELFGHKKGSFTGAVESRNGYLKEVGTGTLFLDEIGELSLEAQKKLLYLLEERKFSPLGSTVAHVFEGRIIMATNRPLEKMVQEKTFREDLYYRIKTFQIELAPIGADPAKLAVLIDELFEQLKQDLQRQHYTMSGELRRHLMGLPWKGNVRELKNALEFALLMSDSSVLKPNDLPPTDAPVEKPNCPVVAGLMDCFSDDFNQSLEIFEKMYLEAILGKYHGRVNLTARKMGVSKTTLIAKAKKYGINTLKLRADASIVNRHLAA